MVACPQNERRRYYRLRYPTSERPAVRINDREFPVAEISEKGIQILVPHECSTGQDASFSAVIQFRDGESIPIEGVVLRREKKFMVVELSKGIPMKRMLVEQSRLRHSHPMLFGSSGDRENRNPP